MESVKVVSKGMKWSQKAMENAAQQHQYIKVGDKPGHLVLSGAPGRWKKPEHAGDVYLPSLRVAGNPAVVRNLFLSFGIPSADIDQHIASGYTAQNYQLPGFSERFDAEVDAYTAWKKGREAAKKTAGGPGVSLDQLQYFVDQLQAASTVARTTAGSPRVGTAVSPGRAPRVRALADRLADATSKGKVLDVSKMDVAKGTGIKMILPPGANSKKVGVPGLAIVSSNPALYAHAIRQLGPQYEPYVQRYNEMLTQKTVIAAPAATAPAVPPPTYTVPAAVAPFPATQSPLAGGVALPTIPGVVQGTVPVTTLPVIGSPRSP